ncbi:hypothetical protein D3C76_957860 [compost metagenome]
MRGALGNLQALGEGLQRQAARLAGKAFQKTEGAFDLTTSHDERVRCEFRRILEENSGISKHPTPIKNVRTS